MAIFILKSIFWGSIFGLFYIYIGYPVLIHVCAKLFPRSSKKGDFFGTLSVVIAVRNEEKTLPDKVHQILQSSCAEQIIELVIASDGSTDDTAKIITSYPDKRVKGIVFDDWRGKAAVLNEVVPSCQGEIVVFTDARQKLPVESLEKLVSNFVDPKVGVVSGELMMGEGGIDSTAAQGMGFYWTYEKWIRKNEAKVGSVPGATGAFYAIRKECFEAFPPNALCDDVIIPMQSIIQGYRCIFEEDALVYDLPSVSTKAESLRKRRTIAGIAQLITLYPSWLAPWRNPIWFQFISHKISRLLSPILLMLAFIVNLMLLNRGQYLELFMLQIIFYWMIMVGHFLRRSQMRIGWLKLPLFFIILNITTFISLIDAIRGRFEPKWRQSTKDLPN